MLSEGLARTAAFVRLPRLRVERGAVVVFCGLTFAIIVLRLPSFFEPPWHTDEGIFAAVSSRVLHGGTLYAEAWESKPPLFLYLYAAIFKLLGVGVLPLRIAATVSAIGTQWALYGAGCRLMSRRQALTASVIGGVLLGVPFWEGTLALTEVFALLPSTLGLLCALVGEERRDHGSGGALWLVGAGALFGAAFLLRQTAVLAGGAFVLWLLLSGRPWLRPSALLALGGMAVVGAVVLAFALFGSFRWFWDANVGFFFDYVPSGQEIPFPYRPLIILPVLIAGACVRHYQRRTGAPSWSLPALWLVLTLAAALLTGRPYAHYFLLAMPPLALLIALIAPCARLSWRPRGEHYPAVALALSLAALWFGVVVPEFGGNLLAMRFSKDWEYYANFTGWAAGVKDKQRYDSYFDKRVYLTLRLEAKLRQLGARDDQIYIWGEYPWVYALSGGVAATRYTTSFYVLLIPDLDVQLGRTLERADPRFIVVLGDVWPKVPDQSGITRRRYENASRAVNGLIAWRYEQVAAIGRARIFERTAERPVVGPRVEGSSAGR